MITKESAERDFTFAPHRKTAITAISDQTVPPGTEVETLEGAYVCAEDSRLAFDDKGNVYPIAESIFQTSYEPL